ncbi:right-handed parallel beta-helix repeat-containing protein [Mucilaginibacter sp.]|jgi:parallel beta-helix repeat protein|uniref:right-handed parallel beta-helix repeat-containing protein n=1 Tax=Mucilaginibacter sp. TaxID=1882438 RepID=UPI0035663542
MKTICKDQKKAKTNEKSRVHHRNEIILSCLLFLLCITYFPCNLLAQTNSTYYVDASLGNDLNSGNNITSPWKTLEKVNSFRFRPGDKILFKRNETFNGHLNIKLNGDVNNFITFSAYGSGKNPIISGFVPISDWKKLGDGIWESDCPLVGSTLNMVLVNNRQKAIGRYPNINSANGGYLTYESHAGNNSIIDNELSDSINWTGAEIVVRRTNWILDRGTILSQLSHKLTYTTLFHYPFRDGFGYFIQNDSRTLDQLGEWSYNPVKKKIQMYFGINNPKNYAVKVSETDELVNVKGSFIVIKNLTLQGSNTSILKIDNSNSVIIASNELKYSGKDGIIEDGNHIEIRNNKINYCNNIGINGKNCPNGIFKNNIISNIGLIPGMGTRYSAVELYGDNIIITDNKITKCGYDGIKLNGNNALIKNNTISYFTMTVDDGGGIYLDRPQFKDRKVINNTISYGVGAPLGTNSQTAFSSEGIYADDSTSVISIIGNVVSNISGHGIKIHNAHDITITNNVLYDNKVQLILDHDNNPAGGTIRNIIVKKNTMASTSEKQMNLLLSSTADDIGLYGSIDSNSYSEPIGVKKTYIMTRILKSSEKGFDLLNWADKYSFDKGSKNILFKRAKRK